MKLYKTSTIARPLEEVYELVRNNIEDIVPYLPNIEKIEIAEEEETDKGVNLVNHWYAKAEIPKVIKKFIKPELLSWKDYAEWVDEDYLVNYHMESFLGNELFDVQGTNSFAAKGENQTELTVECTVAIYPDKVPGVPRIVAKKVAPTIEALIEKMLSPNLTALGEGLNEYFEEHS